MSDEVKEPKYIFDGNKGESLFYKPFPHISGSQQASQETVELQAKATATGDDRSFVLVQALICEHQIDKLLELFMPGYATFLKNTDFTFGQKIGVLAALRLIPSSLLTCAKCIKDIRNEFAHNLNLDNLDGISESRKNTLVGLYDSSYNHQMGRRASEQTVRELFRAITFIANVGLPAYRTNVAILREAITSEQFIEQLRNIVQQRDKAWLDGILSEEPQEVEISEANNTRIEKYRGGVVNVSGLKPGPSTFEIE